MLKTISLIFCSMYFLSHAASSSNGFEEAPIRPGYVGKGLKKFRGGYNWMVTKITRLQNFHRQMHDLPEAMPHEECFGKLGLTHSCGDFAAFMISDFSADINQKQLNAQRIGLTYRLTPQDVADFQSILPSGRRDDILSIFGFLLQDIISDAIDSTDNGTAVSKTFLTYLNGIGPKVNGVNDDKKKRDLVAICERLTTLDANGKNRFGGIMAKLVDDNIEYYLRQGFLSTKVFGFAQGTLMAGGTYVGSRVSSYFCSTDSYAGMVSGAALGFCVGTIVGSNFKKFGSRLARRAQKYFYYDAIRQNAGKIIQGMMAIDGKKSA